MNSAVSTRCIRLATVLGLLMAPLSAWANCTEQYVDIKTISPFEAQAFAKLKAGKDKAYYGRFDGRDIYMAEAFDDLDGQRKEAIITPLPRAWHAEMAQRTYDKLIGPAGGTSPIRVLDHAGRVLYTETPCYGSFLTLTEHQRYLAMFSFNQSDEREFRKQTHPLPASIDMKSVKKKFHGIMSWQPEYFINWAPEGGFFEINLEARGELTKLDAFWPVAPKGYRYDVLLNNGTRIARKAL